MKVTKWQQTVAEFSLEWKRCCFAQCRHDFWQDSLVKEATKHLWQPLSDFDYVLSVYSFLEGVNNGNLLPHLRPVYMAWRSPEQIRLHERYGLHGEDDSPSENTTSISHASRDNGSGAAASEYPLTRGQRLRVARICSDANWMLEGLRYWLDVFQVRRVAFARASTAAQVPSTVMAERQQGLGHAARQFQSHSEILITQLRDSRTGLCEALGLDPGQVPGGDTAPAPEMTATEYESTADIPAPSQGGPELPRSWRLKKASLQAGLIPLKAALYSNLLPGEIVQGMLGRMMARSTEMTTAAREAGDHKAEATMRGLHNKLRKVHKRAGQESPEVKPKMTLLDSVTWDAVLNPREDMQLEIHGDISMPVETLIDVLHAPRVPVGISRPTPGGIIKPPSVAPVTTAPEDPPKAEQEGNEPASSTSSPPGAAREAEAHNA